MISVSGLSIDGVSFTENALAGSHSHIYGINRVSTTIDSRVGRIVILDFDSEIMATDFVKKNIKVLRMTISNGRVIGEKKPSKTMRFRKKVTVVSRGF